MKEDKFLINQDKLLRLKSNQYNLKKINRAQKIKKKNLMNRKILKVNSYKYSGKSAK
jgi:hypothetical protein